MGRKTISISDLMSDFVINNWDIIVKLNINNRGSSISNHRDIQIKGNVNPGLVNP